MYQIDKQHNKINRLAERTFSELGFNERNNLQEWIANDPSCLGEELLIIQKEFDGFHDTRERLDLLALDKQGNLVIIENKLDDSGRDVTWQALKYASYCSSLSKEDIRSIFQQHLGVSEEDQSAEEIISEYLEKEDFSEVQINQGSAQRIMMIAGKFRKEVTSTVIWLMNFNIRIQCFKVTPYSFGEELFLNFDQILPVKEAEEYSISMASKVQEEIATQETRKRSHQHRLDFWNKYLRQCNAVNNLFSGISPSIEGVIGIGIGMSGVNLNLVVANKYARSEIYISRGDKEENKFCFDFLFDRKNKIENVFGAPLIWERMNDKKTCRIKYQLEGASLYDKEDWKRIIDFLVTSAEKMEKAFRNPVKQLNQKLKQQK